MYKMYCFISLAHLCTHVHLFKLGPKMHSFNFSNHFPSQGHGGSGANFGTIRQETSQWQ